MSDKLRKYDNDQDTLALLERVRLNRSKLTEARAQLLRAEALADAVYGAWGLTRHAAAAIRRKAVTLADGFAGSAMRAGERRRDAYLSQSTNTADLEQRTRAWQARWNVIRQPGLRGR